MTNVLPAAFIVLATYALIALGKSIIPGFGTLPNNAIRAIGYVICYAMAAVNLMVQQAVHWQDLWGLLPIAGALFSTSALLYHIGADGPAAAPTGPPAPPPPAATDPAERAPTAAPTAASTAGPTAAPSAPDAAWSHTTISYGPPAEPVGPSAAATPPEPPEKQTPTEAPRPMGPTVTFTSGPPTP